MWRRNGSARVTLTHSSLYMFLHRTLRVCGVLLDLLLDSCASIRDEHQGWVAAMRSAVTVDTDGH